MQTYINTLQDKPEHVRRRILIIGMAVGMVLIVGIWIVSLFVGGGVFARHRALTATVAENKTPSPLVLARDLWHSITGGTTPSLPATNNSTGTSSTTDPTAPSDTIPGMPESYSNGNGASSTMTQ